MQERIVALSAGEALIQIRNIALSKDCSIINEEPSKVVVRHGVVFGYSPTTISKLISFQVASHDSGTRITSDTSLAISQMVVQILGIALLSILAVFGWWLATDVRAYAEGLGSNLARSFLELVRNTDPHQAIKVAGTIEIIVYVCGIGAVFSVLEEIYYYLKRDTFAGRILRLLPTLPPQK